MLARQWFRRAEVHRDTMLHDAVLLKNTVENGKRTATVDHVVLRDDLEPIDDGLLLEDVAIMRNAKPNADSVFRKTVKTIRWHVQPLKSTGERVLRRSRGVTWRRSA